MHVSLNEKMRFIRLFYSSEAKDEVTDMLRERYLFSEKGAIIQVNAFWDKESENAGRGTWELALFAEESVADKLIEDVRAIAKQYPFNSEYPFGIPTETTSAFGPR